MNQKVLQVVVERCTYVSGFRIEELLCHQQPADEYHRQPQKYLRQELLFLELWRASGSYKEKVIFPFSQTPIQIAAKNIDKKFRFL